MLAWVLPLALGCAHRPALAWAAPASVAATPEACSPAPAALAAATAQGLRLDGPAVGALFPELSLVESWIGRAMLRADQVRLCGERLVVEAPELRFWNRRGQSLDVALVTDALVHPRLIMALHRDDLASPPPPGAWLPLDRATLRRVGWTDVGVVRPRRGAGTTDP